MLRFISVAALVLTLAGPAAAMSGTKLLEYCGTPSGANLFPQNFNWCVGYVVAVVDILATGQDVAGWKACIDPKVTHGQAREVVALNRSGFAGGCLV